jgi:hypothetical protein
VKIISEGEEMEMLQRKQEKDAQLNAPVILLEQTKGVSKIGIA